MLYLTNDLSESSENPQNKTNWLGKPIHKYNLRISDSADFPKAQVVTALIITQTKYKMIWK